LSLFSIELKSFRAFRERTTVDFRPLTLFYGYNQAGKSTLLRLLPLLADSIYERQGPLHLNSPVLASPLFSELGHISRDGIPRPPMLCLKTDHSGQVSLELQYGDEGGLIVNRLRVTEPGHAVLDAAWIKTLDQRGNLTAATYQGKLRGAEWSGDLQFDSMIPQGLPPELAALIVQLRQAFAPLQRVQWLRANRIRQDGQASALIRCCAADGADIAASMAGHIRKQVLDQAGAWLMTQDDLADRLMIDSHNRILLGTPGRMELPLYLAGEGVRSLIPILLCACWAESKEARAPSMLAIEEPEAHLHPHLQVALFDRLLQSVSSGIPVVLETHSVYLLRALQLAILEQKIKADDVGLYWVEQDKGQASIKEIGIKPNATLHNWRPDVFEKEQELAQQILERRWQMGGSN
jgi:AAA ATPase domain/AAA domain